MRHPASIEGRFAIVTSVEAGSGGRSTSQHSSRVWTNDVVRTVKPRGPGIPVLMPSLVRSATRVGDGDGGKQAGPRGERGVSRKPTAQGRPGVFGRACGPAARFFVARGPRAPAGARPSLRPCSDEGQ